ncbi:GFA family protein [Oceanibium sediminis]|uniref:GFA family protein n=1 Tax=Oceanibium sediminis TaxID=2026339 RepID=UPI000DD3FE7C|nr:GFA family protein [Oceanibium sediminis]
MRADPEARLGAYHGACACGTVRFFVRADPASSAPCICAKCRGMGLRIVSAARGDFRLLTGQGELTEPISGARTPHHFFCARCGEAAFGFPDGPGGTRVSVNRALLDRGDPDAVDMLAEDAP